MRTLRLFLFVAALVLLVGSIGSAQDFDPNYYYRITNGWQKGKSLDVVNDGDKNNKLQLADTGNFSGQMWKITKLEDGYFRFTNGWQKDKSLDVLNEGEKDQLQLAKTENVTGQMWKLKMLADGYFGLSCKFQGEDKSIDVINDGDKNNRIHLIKTGNFTGQMWKFEKTNVKAE